MNSPDVNCPPNCPLTDEKLKQMLADVVASAFSVRCLDCDMECLYSPPTTEKERLHQHNLLLHPEILGEKSEALSLLDDLDRWVEVTGCVPFGGSWHAEMKSLLKRALFAQQGAEHNEGLVMADLKTALERIHSLESGINKHLATFVDVRDQAKRWTDEQGDGKELDKIIEESIADLDHTANAWGSPQWGAGVLIRKQSLERSRLEAEVISAARTWCFNDITTSMGNEKLLEAVRSLENHMGIKPVTDEMINEAWA